MIALGTRCWKTGAPHWALGVSSGPMVETIYHRSNRLHPAKDAQIEDVFL